MKFSAHLPIFVLFLGIFVLIGAQPAAAAVVLADSFTGAPDGSDLAQRTPEAGGGTYVMHPSASGSLVCDQGRIRASSSTVAHYLHSSTAIPAEFDATITFITVGEGDTNLGFVFRCADAPLTAGRTYYHLLHDDKAWRLLRLDRGMPTTLGVYRVKLTPGVETTVTVRCRNATKTILIDGVERITTTDNAITEHTRVGFRSEGVAGPTGGTHISGFSIDDVAAQP